MLNFLEHINPAYALPLALVILLVAFYYLNLFSEYYFIPSLDRIGERLKLSSDISGSTLMAIGSSAPELAVMIISVWKSGNHEAIGIGTIVGSALFNIFVITGAVMIIKSNAKLVWQPLIRDLVFYAVTILILIFSFKDGHISIVEAGIFVGTYSVYILALYFWKKIFPYIDLEATENNDTNDENSNRHEKISKKILDINFYLVFVVSIFIIGVLSYALVESAIIISGILKVPEFVIALTIIAIGTSVPDLVSSVIVAKQGRVGMAINNGVGSNIFDVLIGLGLPFLFLFIFSDRQTAEVKAAGLDLAFSFLMGSLLILLVMFLTGKWKTGRWMGYLLIILYLVYLAFVIFGKMYV